MKAFMQTMAANGIGFIPALLWQFKALGNSTTSYLRRGGQRLKMSACICWPSIQDSRNMLKRGFWQKAKLNFTPKDKSLSCQTTTWKHLIRRDTRQKDSSQVGEEYPIIINIDFSQAKSDSKVRGWEFATHLNPPPRLQIGFIAADSGLLTPLHHTNPIIRDRTTNQSAVSLMGESERERGCARARAEERERASEPASERGLGWSPVQKPRRRPLRGRLRCETPGKTRQAAARIRSRTKYARSCSEVNQCKVEHWRRIAATALPPLSSDTPTHFSCPRSFFFCD